MKWLRKYKVYVIFGIMYLLLVAFFVGLRMSGYCKG